MKIEETHSKHPSTEKIEETRSKHLSTEKIIKKVGKKKPSWKSLPKKKSILPEADVKCLKITSKYIIGGHIALTRYWEYREYWDKFLTFQCFLHNNHAHFSQGVLEKYKEANFKFKSKNHRIVHSSYVTFPWSSKKDTVERSIQDISIISQCMNILNIKTMVVHLSSKFDKVKNFDKMVVRCLEACEPPSQIAFEPIGNLSSKVDPTPIINIIRVCEKINSLAGKYEWGICLDTAHLFVTGQKLTTKEDMLKLLKKVEKHKLPILLIHLNGSRFPFNSGRDKHAPPSSAFDYIWGKDSGGLQVLVHWCQKKNIPMILELPNLGYPINYYHDIQRIISIFKE